MFELNFGTIYFVWISVLVGGMKNDEGGGCAWLNKHDVWNFPI